jgi:5,10-methylenetetrahydrofolate reductase/methionine synthase I (cobalamin-dependent)
MTWTPTPGSILFADRLGTETIVADGSMTIELSRRGLTERPVERYNLSQQREVERVHEDFLRAGATLLQSNTVHANRYALEASMLSARVHEINRKGVWIARSAANGSAVMVAGTVGPTGRLLRPLGPLDLDDVRSAFTEQISALLAAQCDLILLKSFIDLDELEAAIDVVRSLSADVPIIALKSFPEDGAVLAGNFPATVAQRLTRHGVAAIGSNGTVGPQRMLGVIESLRVSAVPLVALPDVGIPTIVDGRPIYNAEPSYVAQAAVRLVRQGASIIGADGGAGVDHVAAIASAVRGCTPGAAATPPAQAKSTQAQPTPAPSPTPFAAALAAGTFVTTVELDVPRGLDMQSVIDGAAFLARHGVTAVNISDGARARLRMSPIAISAMVQQQTGMECISHLACRDRNMVALQAELLGAHALGVRNILAVTGDPTHIGDYPSATSVYDVDSIGLVRALEHMNRGVDLMGNPLGHPTAFSIACAVNPAADDVEREVDRLAQKCAQGAQVAFSQPIFDPDLLERFLVRIAGLDIKFVLGLIPLRTIRHAEFLHYEVPGMIVPAWVRERLAATATTDEATAIGVELAVDMLAAVHDRVHGVYLMPPFKKYNIAVDIMAAYRERTASAPFTTAQDQI